MHPNDYQSFYDERRQQTYAHDYSRFWADEHAYYKELRSFIDTFDLKNKTCLEIGSSGGFFQDMVDDYHGTDIAHSLSRHYHKTYRVAEGQHYPYEDHEFDAIWTITVFEHIPYLQAAMLEIKRLLKPRGVVFFAPAWQCRPWAAEGYEVRPFSDFGLEGRLIKASIPFRNSLIWRSLLVFPKRLWRHCSFFCGKRYHQIRYRKLIPNYDRFWTSDSDACNHIDPHDAILWFESHGFTCLSHPLHARALLVRTGALVFRKLGGHG
ncbi:class I SAM-dependent methyltransferase [Synechococcus sp. CCY 9618]|uniref:class I SAM-dependent methyltransferase n=1 Tax=Synechococcus sp. CCY 9618 TaxID=2815602 RepID=UPI001C24A258|nr:class I SAM-dependent methyltransferase [Synechococcus sp. CCY 9618]